MAINFVTGLPRAGKTLFTLQRVREEALKDKRDVYTCNIPDVTIPGWQTIKHPDEWLNLPNGSIVIVDELQDFWGMAPTGQKVPMPILELSKHGKRGIDFYFITQEPNLVHKTPRSLCQTHWFVARAFGTHNAVVFKFQRMQDHPEKMKRHGDKLPWRYPKEAFGRVDKETGVVIVPPWYKSADMHNVKRVIPWKLWALPGALLVCGAALWGAYHFGMRMYTAARNGAMGDTAAAAAPASSPAAVRPVGPAQRSRERNPLTATEYVATFVPRVEGLAYTAPRYDDVTRPTVAPFPAACVHMGDKCECYSQQATKMPTPRDLCLQIVRNGYFQDWGEQRRPDPVRPVATNAALDPNQQNAGPVPALVIGAAPTAAPVQVAQAEPPRPVVARVQQKPAPPRH